MFMTCLALFVYKQRKSLVSIQSRWFKDKHEPAHTGQEEIFAMSVDSWGGGAGAGLHIPLDTSPVEKTLSLVSCHLFMDSLFHVYSMIQELVKLL